MRNVAAHREQIGLAALLQRAFEFVADVEMILNRRLAPAGHDHDLIAARRQRFFNAILNDGLSTSASISLGIDLVAGKKRVPNPAAGKIALRTFIGFGISLI